MVVKACFVDDDGDCFHVVCLSGYEPEYGPDDDFMDGQEAGELISEIEDVCKELEERGKHLGITENRDFIDHLESWKEVLDIAIKNPEATIQMV